jgi:hypothetical protein
MRDELDITVTLGTRMHAENRIACGQSRQHTMGQREKLEWRPDEPVRNRM